MHLVRAPRLLRSPHRIQQFKQQSGSKSTVGTWKSIYTFLRSASLLLVSLSNSTSHETTHQAWSWHLHVASQLSDSLDKPLRLLGGSRIGALEAVLHPLASIIHLDISQFAASSYRTIRRIGVSYGDHSTPSYMHLLGIKDTSNVRVIILWMHLKWGWRFSVSLS
jgi:hypothetical protein